jgi:hypothetical protein
MRYLKLVDWCTYYYTSRLEVTRTSKPATFELAEKPFILQKMKESITAPISRKVIAPVWEGDHGNYAVIS